MTAVHIQHIQHVDDESHTSISLVYSVMSWLVNTFYTPAFLLLSLPFVPITVKTIVSNARLCMPERSSYCSPSRPASHTLPLSPSMTLSRIHHMSSSFSGAPSEYVS